MTCFGSNLRAREARAAMSSTGLGRLVAEWTFRFRFGSARTLAWSAVLVLVPAPVELNEIRGRRQQLATAARAIVALAALLARGPALKIPRGKRRWPR